MTKTDEILELVFDYGDSRQHESADKWSVKNIKAAIEELAMDAARYQWIRNYPTGSVAVDDDGDFIWASSFDEVDQLDGAIDAAIGITT